MLLLSITSATNLANAAALSVFVFGSTIKPAHQKIIPTAGKALVEFLNESGFRASFSQDAKLFNDNFLKEQSTVIFLDTSEQVLNRSQQIAVEHYFASGSKILAIHSSIAMGNDWPWFKSLIGTSFKRHPPIHAEKVTLASGPLINLDSPVSWTQEDEWYEFSNDIGPEYKMLASVNTHPVSWCRTFQNSGRFWYTSMGHSESLYTGAGKNFMKHLLSGVKWVTRQDSEVE